MMRTKLLAHGFAHVMQLVILLLVLALVTGCSGRYAAQLPQDAAHPADAQADACSAQDPRCRASDQTTGQLSYAIVVSKATAASSWSQAIAALRARYVGARVYEYGATLDEIKEELRAALPTYICFIHAPPVPRTFVMDEVVPLMRTLDDDPYEDAIWAILTGYTAEDALRIASAMPLRIGTGCSHVGAGWLGWFESGVSWNEGEINAKYVKEPGAAVVQVAGPSDTTEELAEALNDDDKQCMSSSGHADEHTWHLGYNYTSGVMSSNAGELSLRAVDGTTYPMTTTNPKIYYSPGNCLIAHQPDMDAMSLAWLHHGANAFFGHVIKQGNDGCVAFGIADFFFALQERFTYAEAVYLNRQAAMARPEGPTPCLAGTVLYGDPAWDARMKHTTTPMYEQSVSVEDSGNGFSQISFTVTMNTSGSLGQLASALAFLPYRVRDAEQLSCTADACLMSDNFVLLRKEGTLTAGAVQRAVFRARKLAN